MAARSSEWDEGGCMWKDDMCDFKGARGEILAVIELFVS